jgi:hypothetical protein
MSNTEMKEVVIDPISTTENSKLETNQKNDNFPIHYKQNVVQELIDIESEQRKCCWCVIVLIIIGIIIGIIYGTQSNN